MLIVTAGHIDHGKTALVRALTGVETDRLPEEKARGISIDLGFAHWRAAGLDEPIALIDVPGHERYVRAMLAGAGGADFALVVVAANDGLMPQTIEHVRILGLLGIARAAVVVTKCDLVSPERAAEVGTDALALLAETGLPAASPGQCLVFPVSTISGDGIPALAAALMAEAHAAHVRPHGAFRLAVDRAFSVSGAGTVATGTVLAGTVSVGDQLVLSPQGRRVRVRGLQAAGKAVERIAAGQRCAINLAGIDKGDVHRGDWLLDPASHAPSLRIDARISVLADRPAALRHGTTLHVHIGTATLSARLLLRGRAAIAPGESALAALAFEQPAAAVNGDRLVLRDASGRVLLGGGRVIDPLPPRRRRRGDQREAVLAALELHDAAESLRHLLAIPGHEVPAGWFAQCFNLLAPEARALAELTGAEPVGRPGAELYLCATRLAALRSAIPATLADHHARHPELGGISPRDLGKALVPPLSPAALAHVLRALADAGAIALAGQLVRLPGHSPAYAPGEAALWRALVDWLEAGAPRTVTPAEAAAELRTTEAAARAMLMRRRVGGDLWAIDDSRMMMRPHVARLVASAAWLARQSPDGFTAAQFRDATGIGRNHVIRLLEFMDRIGVTARRGEGRIVRGDAESVVGPAEPWLAG